MKTAHKTAFTGAAIAATLIISYLESLIPFSVAVPGVRLGLANLVTLFVLYKLDAKLAAVVSFLRVILAALLFGTVTTLAYSAAGAVLSLIVMVLLKKTKGFSPVGVSCAGAVAHNAGQIGMAILLTETAQIVYYLPVLIVSGIITGLAVGALGAILLKRIDLKTGS